MAAGLCIAVEAPSVPAGAPALAVPRGGVPNSLTYRPPALAEFVSEKKQRIARLAARVAVLLIVQSLLFVNASFKNVVEA
jgi:hypothetical protein